MTIVFQLFAHASGRGGVPWGLAALARGRGRSPLPVAAAGGRVPLHPYVQAGVLTMDVSHKLPY